MQRQWSRSAGEQAPLDDEGKGGAGEEGAAARGQGRQGRQNDTHGKRVGARWTGSLGLILSHMFYLYVLSHLSASGLLKQSQRRLP